MLKAIQKSSWFLFTLLAFIPSSLTSAGTVTYFHTDLLGSPVVMTNNSGNIVWEAEYQPFGIKELNNNNSSSNHIGYTGHVDDAETGLTYMQARYYDPIVGRFMGVDPVGFQQDNAHSFNRYAYANNNPYKYVDPDGKVPLLIPVVVFLGKEAGAELASRATGGLTDFLSVRRLATRSGKFAMKKLASSIEQANREITQQGVNSVPKGASSAKNPANSLKLNKQLGSQQQLGEKGTTIAGPGAKRPFRDAERAARDHGGNPSDFVKKRSSAHTAPDGTKFRTHFIENTKTGQRFEHKTKLVD